MAHSDDKQKKHYFNETRGMTYTDFPQNTRESHMKAAKVKPFPKEAAIEAAVLGPTWDQVDAEVEA